MPVPSLLMTRGNHGVTAEGAAPGGTPKNFGWDIRTAMGQAGGQKVILEDGVYNTGTGSVLAAHAAGSTYDGFLVLEAETPGGVTVDLSGKRLTSTLGTSRICFSGINFENGIFRMEGNELIRFWYCNWTYPIDVWHAQYLAQGCVAYPPAIPRTGGSVNRGTEWPKIMALTQNNSPQITQVAPTSAPNKNIEFYGNDWSEIGDDGFSGYSANDMKMIGCRIWHTRSRTPIADGGDNVEGDPGNSLGSSQDWIHNDSVQTTGGWLRFAMADTWLGQNMQFAGEGKANTDCTFNRVWLAGSTAFGMQIGTAINAAGKILSCTMDDCRAFCNGQLNGAAYNKLSHDYQSFYGGTADWPNTIHIAGQFEFIRTNIDLTIPSGIATTTVSGVPILNNINEVRDHGENPANIWRAANPYSSRDAYFGWP